MIDDLHCLQCRVPVDVVIARNHHYSRPVSIQKAFDEFVKKFLGYGILFGQFGLVIDHSKRHALNKVATYHDRFGGKHPGIFAGNSALDRRREPRSTHHSRSGQQMSDVDPRCGEWKTVYSSNWLPYLLVLPDAVLLSVRIVPYACAISSASSTTVRRQIDSRVQGVRRHCRFLAETHGICVRTAGSGRR